MRNDIHPSALVSSQARLGDNNLLGPHVLIEDDVQLGDGNVLMAGVVLKAGTRLGCHNTVHEYAVLGGLPQDIQFDAATPSFLEIGDHNTLREYVTVNRASQANAATRIGNNNYLMTEVHLGHDCVLGNDIVIAPGTGLGGFVEVADRAFLSGGVMVHQFVHIGGYAMVGGNAKITRNVLPYMITDGVPARVRGLNLIGLQRAGFSREDIRTLKQAYQLIHRSGEPQATIVDGLRALNSPFGAELADFISQARRGYHRET